MQEPEKNTNEREDRKENAKLASYTGPFLLTPPLLAEQRVGCLDKVTSMLAVA